MTAPLLSVILPVYGDGDGACRAVASLGELPFPYEVLLADDGSDAKTRGILSRLAEKNPAVRLLTLPHRGVAAARSAALKEARGENLAFLDSDDLFCTDALPEALALFSKSGAEIGFFAYLYGEKRLCYAPTVTGVFTPEALGGHLSSLSRSCQLNPVWAKLFRRDFICENGLLFPDFCWGEDRVFLSRALQKATGVLLCDRPLYVYTPSENGLCRRYRPERLSLFPLLFREEEALFTALSATSKRDLATRAFRHLSALLSHGESLFSDPAAPRDRAARRAVFTALQKEAVVARDLPKRGLRHRLLALLFSAKSPYPIALFAFFSHRLRVRAPRLFSALVHKK